MAANVLSELRALLVWQEKKLKDCSPLSALNRLTVPLLAQAEYSDHKFSWIGRRADTHRLTSGLKTDCSKNPPVSGESVSYSSCIEE